MGRLPQRRRDPRFEVLPHRPGRLEFALPFPDGPVWTAELTDISVAGVAFSFGREPVPELAPGTRIPQASLTVGPCEIQGDVVVRWAGSGSVRHRVFGGFFYPFTERDELKLMSLLSGIESALGETVGRGLG